MPATQLPLQTAVQPAALAPKAVQPAASPVRRRQLPQVPRVRAISEAEKAGLAVLEGEFGGRAALVVALAQAELGGDEAKFLGALADPDNDRLALAEICALHRVAPNKIVRLVRAAILTKAQLLSTKHIAEHLPAVARGVMEDAIPGQRTCDRCQGLTTISKPGTTPDDPPQAVPCPTCAGKGTTLYAPETDIRKMALGLGGLLDKGAGGVHVTTNVTAKAAAGASGGLSGGESFDQLMGMFDAVLYGSGRERTARGAGAEQDQEFELPPAAGTDVAEGVIVDDDAAGEDAAGEDAAGGGASGAPGGAG